MMPALRPAATACALAALAAASLVSAAPAEVGRPAEPVTSPASVLSHEDYPADAIKNREQGRVSFRLAIDSAGRVTGCEVIESSGSASLDSTTCRLMSARIRFHPAADAVGKPAAGTYEGRIVWRLPDPSTPRIDLPRRPAAAIGLWSACLDGEAAKLALSASTAPEIANRAFPVCTELEGRILREIAEAKIGTFDARRFIQALRDDFTTRLAPRLEQIRSELGPPGK